MNEQLFAQREDWTELRTIDGVGRRGGVPVAWIPRLVVKELVDNAYDSGASRVEWGPLSDGGFFIEDDGQGIDGNDEDLATLFSVGRPYSSTKSLRRPTRGLLGNGLRVVAGAVLASRGALILRTRDRALHLEPRDDGTTAVSATEPWDGEGTRVEVWLGQQLDNDDEGLFDWAQQVEELAGRGTSYKGKSSPWWYDRDSFWTAVQSYGEIPVRAVIALLDGCAEPKAGEVARDFLHREAGSLTRDEAATLLARARELCRPVEPSRLGRVGARDDFRGYSRVLVGTFTPLHANQDTPPVIPFVVEAWANVANEPSAVVCVNRTPVATDVQVRRQRKKTECAIFGCNLRHIFTAGQKHDYAFLVNIQCPRLALMSDSKAPDLLPLVNHIREALAAAARNAAKNYRRTSGSTKRSQKNVILGSLGDAVQRVSGGGRYRYSLRQLFYAIRPLFIKAFGQEPLYKTFAGIIADHEFQVGKDLPGIYRDSRGTLYHPHTGEEIPLGTLSVEKYKRPKWTFKHVLYAEKEGLFPILKEARWPERHDCALLTSKGFATKAVRDVMDLLGETVEPVKFFCIHDADGPGTGIFEAMLKGAAARPSRRKVDIINLGLEPEEALAMELDPEPVKPKKGKDGKPRTVPVADYVPDKWKAWLQEHRVELNAMSTPEFLKWLDQKMQPHDSGKLIPPADVMAREMGEKVQEKIRQKLTEKILREANLDGQVNRAFAELKPAFGNQSKRLPATVRKALEKEPADSWRKPIDQAAEKLAERIAGQTLLGAPSAPSEDVPNDP